MTRLYHATSSYFLEKIINGDVGHPLEREGVIDLCVSLWGVMVQIWPDLKQSDQRKSDAINGIIEKNPLPDLRSSISAIEKISEKMKNNNLFDYGGVM